ncbi:CMGC family protein kinase [Trichomonas vaginalis G3]|uniref:Mitogen-activated protein kinase n=1 Tax=Trichomonas vaginalis (strain ATCC PRA-98 / G3) TaxID=412133 RepID=A2FMB8_TRIV3|nr:CMGC family protein kinase [Trichomonas vaginalis G3]|eukprot:XP_001306865.1 CMGC family protein kinase [Trichomonas vaginalis G3]
MELPHLKICLEDIEAEAGGRYKVLNIIGRGSYGVVLLAIDNQTGKHVALKQLQRIFTTVTDAKRVLREIRILSSLNNENITNITDVVTYPDYSKFSTLIVVSDIMDTDLYKLLISNVDLSLDYRKYFAYQIIRGLKYIHSANILHRDLKPSNILVNSNSELKITDFGLARVLDQEEGGEPLSEYVTTRWYRAPEILLNYGTYGPAIDIWSTGCILAEIILRRPLFPGNGTLHQLQLIQDFLGSPTEQDLELLRNPKARQFMESLPPKDPVDWHQIFTNSPEEEIDLISKMLTWDPRKRITVLDALEHPFLDEYHDPVDEPSAFPMDGFEFDREDITMEEIRETLWREILRFHPEFAK